MFRTLEFFSDTINNSDSEESGGFLNELLDLDPTIQSHIISEFRDGSTDETIAAIATSRGFIQRLGRQRTKARMESPRAKSTDEDQPALREYLELERAILARCGFTASEQSDIIDAWSMPWSKGLRSVLPWKRRQEDKDRLSFQPLNLEAMARLYRQAQQAPKLLYNAYGIHNFVRYYDEKTGTSVLEPQAAPDYVPRKEMVLTDIEDGVMAFMNPKPYENAKSINLDNPTYMEARIDKRNIRKVFASMMGLVRQSGTPIERLLVNAHGDKKAVGDLTIEDLQNNSILEKLRGRLFSSNAMIILDSCFTGVRDGIAEYFVKRTNIDVSAPAFESFGAHDVRGGDVTFDRKKGRGYHPVRGDRYAASSYIHRPSDFTRRP